MIHRQRSKVRGWLDHGIDCSEVIPILLPITGEVVLYHIAFLVTTVICGHDLFMRRIYLISYALR